METNILTTTLTNETSPELLRNEIDSRIVKIRPTTTLLAPSRPELAPRISAPCRIDAC